VLLEALTFESVDEILLCDHSYETSSAVLSHGNIAFSQLYKIFFFFLELHKGGLPLSLINASGVSELKQSLLCISRISQSGRSFWCVVCLPLELLSQGRQGKAI